MGLRRKFLDAFKRELRKASTQSYKNRGALLPPASERVAVRKKDAPRSWPFTVDEGHLGRVGDAALFIYEGKGYALNGVASTQGWAELGSLWRPDPIIHGAHVSLTDSIAAALGDDEALARLRE